MHSGRLIASLGSALVARSLLLAGLGGAAAGGAPVHAGFQMHCTRSGIVSVPDPEVAGLANRRGVAGGFQRVQMENGKFGDSVQSALGVVKKQIRPNSGKGGNACDPDILDEAHLAAAWRQVVNGLNFKLAFRQKASSKSCYATVFVPNGGMEAFESASTEECTVLPGTASVLSNK